MPPLKRSTVLAVLCVCILGVVLVLAPAGHIDDVLLRQPNAHPPPHHHADDASTTSGDHAVETAQRGAASPPPQQQQSPPPLVLPVGYPVHRALPPRQVLFSGLQAQRAKRCDAAALLEMSPLLSPQPPASDAADAGNSGEKRKASSARDDDAAMRSTLQQQFETPIDSPVFSASGEPWWVPFESTSTSLGAAAANSRLPCTEEVQELLAAWQNPESCDAPAVKGIISPLKEGAHGVGSAITLLAHDFLSALLLQRRLVIAQTARWFFAPAGCSRGWECLFGPATRCKFASERAHVVHSAGEAQRSPHRLVVKQGFDIKGLSRNDFPTVDAFFDTLLLSQPQQHHHQQQSSPDASGRRRRNRLSADQVRSKCVPLARAWAADDANRALMGTFREGASPLLAYQLAQVTAYLMRAVQPWFRQVIASHLRTIMLRPGGGVRDRDHKSPPQQQRLVSVRDTRAVVFVHDRGELAKYREYYNSFGCHKLSQAAYRREAVEHLCGGDGGAADAGTCVVFVSGNMPRAEFTTFERDIVAAHGPAVVVTSTWNLVASAAANNNSNREGRGASETDRWGAAHPAASWLDLFAGMHATGWACVVQSNWCRVIDFLRMTLVARAACPFVDMGIAALADASLRLPENCIVRSEWPKKPYRGSKIAADFEVK